MMRLGQRGVSLMEAVVALAVMGFGMLGVAAMQSSLRQNADLARQRAEAVRLAQDAIERNRSYSVIATTALKQAYDDIPVADSNNTFSGTNRNASYTRAVAAAASAPFNLTTVKATVTWTDRANNTQSVLLASQIHRVPPELAGSLIVDGSRTVPQLRNGSSQVPPGWRDNGNGSFSPPVTQGSPTPPNYFFGGGGIVATSASCFVIPLPPAPPPACSYYRVVQGYVVFSTAAAPTPAQAENPTSDALLKVLQVSPATPPLASLIAINQTAPGSPPDPMCFYQQLGYPPSYLPPIKSVAYSCLIGISALNGDNSRWSGSLSLAFVGVAANNSEASDSLYRVCRYTRYLNDDLVGTIEGETNLAFANADHPKLYASVSQNLVNQNFLIIKAGDGSVPYACPDDDSLTPLVNGRTWQHPPNNP